MADNVPPSIPGFPDKDSDWSSDQWKSLLEDLVTAGLMSWTGIATLALGHLNPSQVGTSIASRKSFQRHFEKRQTWLNVREWHFEQSGKCADCGTRLELQADHRIPKEIVRDVGKEIVETGISDSEELMDTIVARLNEALKPISDEDDSEELQTNGDEDIPEELQTNGDEDIPEELQTNGDEDIPEELLRAIHVGLRDVILAGVREPRELAEVADRLENMVLRCRRCNVVRRPSHKQGGKTFLTSEAALMWILFLKRPETYQEFERECRSYGLTMANIRFQEAWAMARWLQRAGSYFIAPDSKF